MEAAGYMFVYKCVDSQKYLVRQRRNRVWGVTIPRSGCEQDGLFSARFDAMLEHLENIGISFPVDAIFDSTLPKETMSNRTLARHVREASAKAMLAGRSDDVYVDAHTSSQGKALGTSFEHWAQL